MACSNLIPGVLKVVKLKMYLRVLALGTGTMHALFQRERDGLLDIIPVSHQVLTAEKEVKLLGKTF